MSHSTGDPLKQAVDSGDLGVALGLQDVLQHPATTQLVLAACAEMRALGVDKGHHKMGVAVRCCVHCLTTTRRSGEEGGHHRG